MVTSFRLFALKGRYARKTSVHILKNLIGIYNIFLTQKRRIALHLVLCATLICIACETWRKYGGGHSEAPFEGHRHR